MKEKKDKGEPIKKIATEEIMNGIGLAILWAEL